MTYEETLHYLYTRVPVFQHSGASAYKPGLDTSLSLDKYLAYPHKAYKTIHVAGTNGKGSTSHLLAAVLQKSGYKVGLYTSPHLVDFRERIRVDGKMIDKQYVVDFIEKHRSYFETLSPSFFELTMSMAFDYFRSQAVDVAVIEVGLGGRLDSTNIIDPDLCVITNISKDHVQFLGDTLEQIAYEKAGIIKEGIPVIIGEAGIESVKDVFVSKAGAENAPIRFAEQSGVIRSSAISDNGHWVYDTTDYGTIEGELGGVVQEKNTCTVLTAIRELLSLGYKITPQAVKTGFAQVTGLTGLMGRWQIIQRNPLIICDTGHNVGGWEYLSKQLDQTPCHALHIVIGMVNDKDIHGVLKLLPKKAIYYFTNASVERALPAEEFALQASEHGLKGTIHSSVALAIEAAKNAAEPNDCIFIGGSTFIISDALIALKLDIYN